MTTPRNACSRTNSQIDGGASTVNTAAVPPTTRLFRFENTRHTRTHAHTIKMIKGIIIVNNHGNPRLVKFYQTVESEAQQQSVIRRVFQQVSSRPDSFCNYLEGIVPEWGDNIKLIYRHYATLYFVFAVDAQESDLGILDLIQVFVEALDKSFQNVCELDLIFHSDRVHYILDEVVMGGMVLETNIVSVLQAINDQDKLHAKSEHRVGQ
jgi:AP-3 complex subunit sigma